MKFRSLLAIALLLLAAGARETPAADDWVGSLNFSIGPKSMDDDVKPAEDQTQFGLRWSFGKTSWPIMLAVDVSTSTGDGSEAYSYYYYPYGTYYGSLDADIDTTELSFGVRKEWGKKNVHPFLGGGVEYIQVDAKVDVNIIGIGSFNFVDDSASDLGVWIDGGVYWRLGKAFNLGFNVRYSDAEVALREEFFGTEFDVDVSGIQYGVLLGWGW